MSTILYLAYGSNMYSARLRYRVPNCLFRFVAQLPGHRLCFHKGGSDGSAKCNALSTGISTDAITGVVYEIRMNEKPNLDRAEGLGRGYHQESLRVISPEGHEMEAYAYIADETAIESDLRPFTWYKDLVLEGAKEHRLPAQYVANFIAAVPAIRDPDRAREQKMRAGKMGERPSAGRLPLVPPI